MTDWSTALDDFERHLVQVRAVLDRDEEPLAERWPPADLTSQPIPVEEIKRAQRLLQKAFELEEELIARRATMPEPRTPIRRRRQSYPTMSTRL